MQLSSSLCVKPRTAATTRPSRRIQTLVKAQLEPDKTWQPDIPKPARSGTLRPSFLLSREDAVLAQLKALQHNNFPTNDHGIEVCYRFAGFSPWERSSYFGGSLAHDLGQFERFRRLFYTSCHVTILNHTEHEFLSSLEVSEDVWKTRVRVFNAYRKEENVYEFTMAQKCGGRYDGIWYCMMLACDGCDDRNLYGVI